ncbi:hypothetical protein QBC36DRAFT_323720 [Triangularia setosa]|uniref:Uncharacterized protein n=1 Tax=Triangularia setosa TaxID=2587417 RepID=A0AAN6WCB4_9PEZI|nr:hypothetical protein QBC36DRAFT_323720 [Podospora setosa]
MDPNDAYPCDLLDHAKAPLATLPPQQNNVPMSDAPRFTPQDQDVDMEDVPVEAATGTRETTPHHQYQGQAKYTGQPFPLPLSPSQQLLPNLLGAHQQQSPPWQPVQAPRYRCTGQQLLPPAVLSCDPTYQHDLKPIVHVTLHTPMPGHEHIRRTEYIPMVFKSAQGETKVIWDVVMDGSHYDYTNEPRLHYQQAASDMGQAV